MKSRTLITGLPLLAALLLTACQRDPVAGEASASVPSAPPVARHGGEATILLGAAFGGSWSSGLDPATNITAGANLSLMNSIFGGLFQLMADEDGRNARVVGVLAEGYEIADEGRTLVIRVRSGVTFSDGTPFDAEAVRFNIERNLNSSCPCTPAGWPWVKEKRVTVLDGNRVALHFTRPYGPVLNSFTTSNLNWVASPGALKQMGEEAFRIKPVGAGPFRVVSNQLSSRLVLERNPLYWQKDRPYLDRLVFQSIGTEQAAYQALLAGDAHAYEGMVSMALLDEAEASGKISVTRPLPTQSYFVQLNVAVAPFNDARAREAIYYASNVPAIRQGLFKNRYPMSQSFTGPGGLFHHDTIPGYRTFDPEKARKIVRELGGIKVTLSTLKSALAEQQIIALQSQWREVGIDVSIETYDLGTLISQFQSRKWQAILQTVGAYDPDAGNGIIFRFGSESTFSGVKDPELDRLMKDAAGSVDPPVRDALYLQISKHLSDNAYAPFLISLSPSQVTRGIVAPGLSSPIPPVLVNSTVIWQEAWLAP